MTANCKHCTRNGWYESFSGGFAHEMPCEHCNPEGLPAQDKSEARSVGGIQADRDAAHALLGGAAPDGLLEGRHDSLSVVQALARHRIEAQAELVEALRWALAELNGKTRYDNDEQRENCFAGAEAALAKAGAV